jgi:hypothetical protein
MELEARRRRQAVPAKPATKYAAKSSVALNAFESLMCGILHSFLVGKELLGVE